MTQIPTPITVNMPASMALCGTHQADGCENHQSQEPASSSWLQEGIRLLPPEILIHIFIFATPPEFSSCCTARYYPSFLSVCKTWRDLALGTPEIWSYIRTTYDKSLPPEADKPSPPKLELILNIELWISRSMESPLRVAINLVKGEWRLLCYQMPRWRHVQCGPKVYKRIYQMHSTYNSADKLEHLEVEQASLYGDWNQHRGLTFTNNAFPNLVYLRINRLDFKWPFPLAPRLRTLWLSECTLPSNALRQITNHSPSIEVLKVPPINPDNTDQEVVKSFDRLWSCHYACNSGVLNLGFLKFARNLTHLEFGLFYSQEICEIVLSSVINLTLSVECSGHSTPVRGDEVLKICPNLRSLKIRSIDGKLDNQYSFFASAVLLAALSKCQDEICAPHLTHLTMENLPISRADLKQFAENRMDPSRSVALSGRTCIHSDGSTRCRTCQRNVRITLSECYACPQVQNVNYRDLIAAVNAMKPIWSHLVGGPRGGDMTDVRIARGDISRTGAVFRRQWR